MKQVTNRIVDLFKGLKGSATLGQRDSLIELGPVVSSVIELPGPLKNANQGGVAPGTVLSDTFYMSMIQVFVGAHALSQIFSNQVLDSGLWHIRGFFYSAWVTASADSNGANAGLQDPEGFTVVLARSTRLQTSNGSINQTIDQIVSLDRPGWRFVNQTDAQGAPQSQYAEFDVICSKLL